MRGLFIGGYPNEVEPYRCVFFQEFVHACARLGNECYVIAPVSITSYKLDVQRIKYNTIEDAGNNAYVKVYHPRMVTYSAKKIGSWNTIHLTLKSTYSAVLSTYKKLDIEFDFVYGHFFLGGGLIASKLGQLYGIPAYLAYGECDFESEVRKKYGEISPKELEGLHGIISVSTNNSNDLKDRCFTGDIPIFVCPNAVDSTRFHKMDKKSCREKLGMPLDDFIVGFVGYFIERKGYNRLLEACEGLDNVKLAFAGKGSSTPQGENIVFCNSLKHEDVAVFLNAVDVFALPTLNEGCCNAVVEAMACGKAIVSSDLPFNYDVLNSHNSILIDPQNIQAIRSAIIKLRDDSALLQRLEEKALMGASELSIDSRAAKIINFIDKSKGSSNE